MNKLIIISGPGGSGKDSVIDKLMDDKDFELIRLVNHTSRQPRTGEQNGVDYYFMTREEFEHEIKHEHMLEYEVMEANHQYYGTHKDQLLNDLKKSHVICRKMPIGALELKKYFNDQAITVFLDADNDELEKRLLHDNRSLEHSQVKRRLEQASHERQLKNKFDVSLVNHEGELDDVVAKVRKFINENLS